MTRARRFIGSALLLCAALDTPPTAQAATAAESNRAELLAAYPQLQPDDIRAALSYAAWRAEERELPLQAS